LFGFRAPAVGVGSRQPVAKRWIWIGVGLAVALCVSAVAASAPLAKRMLVARARERGVLLSARRVEVGMSGLRLRHVHIALVGVPGLTADLEQVGVGLRVWGLTWSRLDARGGRLDMNGSPSDLAESLRAWRSRFGEARGVGRGSSSTTARPVTVSKLSGRWQLGDGEELHIGGLAFEQLGTGPARAGADRLTFGRPGLSVDAAGVEVGVQRGASGVHLPSARVSEMRLSLRVGGDEDDAPSAPAKATEVTDSASKSARPGLAERWVTHPDRVVALRAGLELVRRLVKEKLPPHVSVERLWLGVESGNQQMAVGPSRLELARTDLALDWSLVPLERARGTPLELSGQVPSHQGAPLTIRLRGGPVTFSQLGVKEGDFGLAAVAGSTLEGQADVELSADSTKWSMTGSWTLENLALRAERLARETILVPRIAARGTVRGAVDGSSFALEDAELTIGQAHVDGRVLLVRTGDKVVFEAGMRAPLVGCQALLDSAPRALLGPVADTRWTGTFSLDANVRADSSALGEMSVLWKFENGCRVTAVPGELDPERFRGPFTLEVVGAGGVPQMMEFGPGTEHFVPIDNMSPHLETALLVTEDGRFHRHRGFDDRAIESAIRDNVRAGSFVRGASTLSMQLAKNLYLSRTKTLSRKLQEAALTVLLEQNFSKRELLELYLNVVEFGPGIYGAGPAAAYYFAQTAGNLTPAQAFFLASLLPAPTVQHFGADGRLSASRQRHVHSLLRIAHQRERLTEDEVARALAEELRFGVADSHPAGSTTTTDPSALPVVPHLQPSGTWP
jgi:hypothetical protein